MAGVALLSRYSQDVVADGRAAARYIGNLEQGRSRVSVNSGLVAGDREDYFRFRMTAAGFVRLRTGELVGDRGKGVEVAKDGEVRYQLLSGSGRVIADSDNRSGAAYDQWLALTSDRNLNLARGSYTLRVARGTAAVERREYVYSFTLRSDQEPVTATSPDRASREFLTTERPAPAQPRFDRFANVTTVLGHYVSLLAW